MKRARSLSLGTKLNLALLAFLLLLGAATLAIIVYGFNRTRDNANARSNEALEEGGRLALQAVAGGASEQGGLLFEAVGEVGRRAALFIETESQTTAQDASPPPALMLDASGIYADPNPARITDLVLINGAPPPADARVIDDIAFSAPLSLIFPVLLRSYEGEVGGSNLDPIAISFISTNGVARLYPPSDAHVLRFGIGDLAARLAPIGPEQNPARDTIWTAPYDEGDGRGLIVTARTPVYDGDTFRGSIDVDVSMGNVFAQINRIRPTPGAFAFYVDKEGTLLEGRSFPLLNTESQDNPELIRALDAMRSIAPDDTTTSDARVALAGEDYFIAYTRVLVLGGTFAVAAPVTDLTAATAGISSGIDDEGTRTLQVTVAAMGALFVLGLAGAGFLNRHAVIKPINRLVAAARAVGAGDLDARVPVSGGGDEFDELGLAFNTMVEQLRESERALEQRVEQRTRELDALLRADAGLHQSLDLDSVLEALSDAMVESLNADKCIVTMRARDADHLVIRAQRNMSPASIARFNEIYAKQVGRSLRTISGITTYDDISATDPEVRAILEEEGVRSMIDAPIFTPDGVAGGFALGYTSPHTFTNDELRLAQAIAERAGAAIRNAQLADEAARRARETEALVRADAELFRSLNLETVLQALVDVAVDVVGVDTSLVTIWDREAGTVEVRASRNLAPGELAAFKTMLPAAGAVLPDDVQPNVYESLHDVPDSIREVMRPFGKQAAMDVPIRSATGEILGGYGVGYAQPHVFTVDERRLLVALAERAAVAIQNAALYERAQQVGSLEERQRLARELHDSVSQALYGIALGTRTARLRLGDDPHNAAEPIDYVASLAQAGLAEMRALIFELRPESLEQEGLVAAIEKHAASTRARYGLDVRLDLTEEPELAIQKKEALYRIAQEALHNVVKHAEATIVRVALRADAGSLVLSVADDGRGFDAHASFPGHVGLQSMSERAERLGGSLSVESSDNGGTVVTARLPL